MVVLFLCYTFVRFFCFVFYNLAVLHGASNGLCDSQQKMFELSSLFARAPGGKALDSSVYYHQPLYELGIRYALVLDWVRWCWYILCTIAHFG